MTGPKLFDDGYTGLRQLEDALPSHWLYDPEHYKLELDVIWSRNWVYLCRANTLEKPGSYRTFTLGQQQIVVVRDEAGGLRAFHNTCRHRGARLCQGESGQLGGNRIQCQYHRWIYSLQGELLRTSSLAQPEGFKLEDFSLYNVAVQEWRGFVFVNLAANAGSVTESFHQASDNLDNWPLEELVVGYTFRKVINCNWKLFWDNFLECLHCPGVHPELCNLAPIYSRGIIDKHDDPRWREHADSTDPRYKGGLKPGAVTWSPDGKPVGPIFKELTEAEARSGHKYVVSRPSFYIIAHPDYVRAVRLHPLSPEQTELTAQWLYTPETLATPGFDAAKIAEFGKTVVEQDATVCELNQQGVRANPHKKGVLMPEEYLLKECQDWVRDQLKNKP